MKRILLLLVCLIWLTGCNATEISNRAEDENATSTYQFKHTIIQVDGCEYLMFSSSPSHLVITHKGNCKFCAIRYHVAPETDIALEKRRTLTESALKKLTDEEKAVLGLK